jgi:hypothetical protein
MSGLVAIRVLAAGVALAAGAVAAVLAALLVQHAV